MLAALVWVGAAFGLSAFVAVVPILLSLWALWLLASALRLRLQIRRLQDQEDRGLTELEDGAAARRTLLAPDTVLLVAAAAAGIVVVVVRVVA